VVHIRLRELRELKGLKQYEIAKLLNISNNAYSQYETGKRQMGYEALCMIADFFSVSIDCILGRNENALLITDEEKEIILKYRTLDQRGKQNISGLLDLETTRLPPPNP